MPWTEKTNHVQIALLGVLSLHRGNEVKWIRLAATWRDLGLVTPQSILHFLCGSLLSPTPSSLALILTKYGKPLYSEHTVPDSAEGVVRSASFSAV